MTWIRAASLLSPGGEGLDSMNNPGDHEIRASLHAIWPEVSERVGRRDRACSLGLIVGYRLLQQVPLSPEERSSTALILGTALGCAVANENYHRSLVQNPRAANLPALFIYTVPSAPVGELAMALGFMGEQLTVMGGRSAGLLALGEAVRGIRLGRYSRALVLSGEILCPDRRTLRGDDPVECWVGMLVEGQRSPDSLAEIVSVERGFTPEPSAVEGPEYLGSAGPVALLQGLSTGRHTTRIEDPSGIWAQITVRT